MPIKISNILSSETTGPIRVRFYTEHLCLTGTKVYIIGPNDMTKMTVMPYMVKIIKNLLLQNHKSDNFETK